MPTYTYYIPHIPNRPTKAGEVWYVKIQDCKEVAEVEVTDVTTHTVKIMHRNVIGLRGHRYEWSDIRFIERVEDV